MRKLVRLTASSLSTSVSVDWMRGESFLGIQRHIGRNQAHRYVEVDGGTEHGYLYRYRYADDDDFCFGPSKSYQISSKLKLC
ncbi:hypothetical protein BS50DRAFT_307713 [Corynespora cassiicola Philippines]|uniref:Uncharacterized protein n=1 Tax=Corynespora cassiicola Philippines TaxID=1448308 RepID=A0A2T2NXN8_CORCC|nr:hypothetical protein BS50DRAFT_307713 [Corynespora cassiicola Philippines]